MNSSALFFSAAHFSYFPSSEIRPLCFLSLALALSLLSTSVWTLKLSKKNDSAWLWFFLSKTPGGHAIYRQNAQVSEVRNFIPAYMNGWTYGRT